MSRSNHKQFMATKVQAYTPPPKKVVSPTGREAFPWMLIVKKTGAVFFPLVLTAKSKSEARAEFKRQFGWLRIPAECSVVLA